MSRNRLVALFLVSGILAAAAGALAARWPFRYEQPAPPDPEHSALCIDPKYLDFGEVWETKDFVWSVPVVNRGQRPVTVEQITGSCTCMAVSPEQFTIGPGETQVLTVHVDFTVKPPKNNAASFQLRYRTAGRDAATNNTGVWLISGKVKPFLTLEAPFDFGTRSSLDQPFSPVTVATKFATQIEHVSVITLDPRIQVSANCPGKCERCQITLSTVSTFPFGKIDSFLLLKTRMTTGEEREDRIPVTGRVVRDVGLTPPAFPAGGRWVGESFEFDVTASSLTRKPFSITEVKAIGNGLSVSKAGDRYIVRQICLSTGEQTGSVEFTIEGVDGKYIIRALVDYTGIKP